MTATAPKFEDFSEAEIADLFVYRHRDDVRYIAERDEWWLLYDDDGWRTGPAAMLCIESEVLELCDEARAEDALINSKTLKFEFAVSIIRELGSSAFVDNTIRQIRRRSSIRAKEHPRGDGWVLAENEFGREFVNRHGAYQVEKVGQ